MGRGDIEGTVSLARTRDLENIDPESKEFSLAYLLSRSNWNLINTELSKCILVCANCHRVLHQEKEKSNGTETEESCEQRAEAMVAEPNVYQNFQPMPT